MRPILLSGHERALTQVKCASSIYARPIAPYHMMLAIYVQCYII